MNADQRILQILENSACLSKGQLLGYLKHNLYPEELRAVELHLSTCALCSDALEGLELQQDPDGLLASLIPPVLPAIAAPKEKPKEKKEPVPTVKQDKVPVAAAPSRNQAGAAQATENANVQRLQPRNRLLRPLGIAAALVLGFGALWYFEFRKEDKPGMLAQQADPERNLPAVQDTANLQAAASLAVADEAKIQTAEQKHRDSLLIAKKAEARHKAHKDSMALLAMKEASTANQTDGLVAKQTEAEQESTAVASDAAARKMMAAAPIARKEEPKKEDRKETKKVMTDYELGMQKYKEKNYASALLYFKSAESDKGDPKHWEATYYSALCNKNLDKRRRAIKLFERVVDANAPQKRAAQKQLDEMNKKDKE